MPIRLVSEVQGPSFFLHMARLAYPLPSSITMVVPASRRFPWHNRERAAALIDDAYEPGAKTRGIYKAVEMTAAA